MVAPGTERVTARPDATRGEAEHAGQGGSLSADITLRRSGFELEVAVTATPGQVLAVIGPNGAGKTTLLRVLAGLVAPSRGWIGVGERVWADTDRDLLLPASARRVGVVFQDYRLFPHLSVLDNVAFAARSRGASRRAARAGAHGVLDRLDLASLAARRPAMLSGGQAQRVALARALAADPVVLLLDEPLAALDARSRLEVRTELRRHLSAFAGPSVLVTHDPVEAMVLADSLLVLEGGRVVQYGTPAAVARRPATQYVARLVGLNLYHGRVADPAAGRIEIDSGGTLFAAGQDDDAAAEGAAYPVATRQGERVLVRLQPTAVSVFTHHPDAGSARNVWCGQVAGVELLTDRVRVAVEGGPDVLADITPAALADLRLTVGQEVWLTAKATEVTAYPESSPSRTPPDQ